MKIKNDNKCTFCKYENETIEHLFIGCEQVDRIWNQIETWIYDKCNILLNFSKQEIIFGKPGKQFVAQNMIVYIAKLYIYKQRVNNEPMYFPSVKKEILNYYAMEKYMYFINRKFKQFQDRWKILKNLESQNNHCNEIDTELVLTSDNVTETIHI